jgi:uncharacterized membrane protein
MQNPYAPPKDFGLLPGAQPGPGGAPQGWTTGEVLQIGWEATKRYWPVVIGAMLIWWVPSMTLSSVPALAVLLELVPPDSLEYWAIYAVSTLVSMVVSYFLQVGYIRIALAAARGERPDLPAIFSGFDRFLPFFVTSILFYTAVMLGSLLLIVPGVILFLGFGLATFYCVDAGMGPIASLRASWNAMRGHKGGMFVFLCAGMLVYIVGILACCVGALPALAVLYVAWAAIYVRLSGYQKAPLEAVGA